MSSGGLPRATALRAGGACTRCRKGKTKCVYDNGRPPCKNCLKGMHDCYLPSESMAHHRGHSPARHANTHHRPARESLPASGPGTSEPRQQSVVGAVSSARSVPMAPEKVTPELIAECERVVYKTFPACVAFHRPSFIQQLKDGSLDSSLLYGLLTCAARSSPTLIRRYTSPTKAAETFAAKAIVHINQNLDNPGLADIQALCLVVIHEWGTGNAVRAYIYLGQAARMLQMYRILNSHNGSDKADRFLRDESLRRTLWLVYILDCLLTSTPGRFSALSAGDTADVSLPCSDMNFTFGNAIYVMPLPNDIGRIGLSPSHAGGGEIGEFGYIVLATKIWRDVVGMLTAETVHAFREEHCTDLLVKIEKLRATLPMQLVDKPGQINSHMTMGSGYTFAMLHCLLHCATIFIRRRQLLQHVKSPSFSLEWNSYRHDLVDGLLTSCHATSVLLNAVEAGQEKDSPTCFPIVMLFSAFTSSATVAYLSLKGLTPPNAVETAAHIVRDGLKFMHNGTASWPLMSIWHRHLDIMQRVLNNDAGSVSGNSTTSSSRHGSGSRNSGSGVKDEVSSNADSNTDNMEYEVHGAAGGVAGAAGAVGAAHLSTAVRSVSESARGDSEPPVAIPPRRGVTTINGGSGVAGAAATAAAAAAASTSSPIGAPQALMQPTNGKQASPGASPNGVATMQDGQVPSQDMTAPELCQAFEKQLLDLDDLAAFMGGGV
ncbi:hypothetical protein E4U21_004872 [Claviceps maximensis]|nr:hypothetical protein E4U21_004872 [Claviceps maximensis]